MIRAGGQVDEVFYGKQTITSVETASQKRGDRERNDRLVMVVCSEVCSEVCPVVCCFSHSLSCRKARKSSSALVHKGAGLFLFFSILVLGHSHGIPGIIAAAR